MKKYLITGLLVLVPLVITILVLKTLIGVSTRVDVLEPDGIERSMGKARRVIDTRPK